MISFRYHLVSIVAVFLALAIGLLVGATALEPPAEKALNSASRNEEQRIRSLLGDIRALDSQLGTDRAFAEAAAVPMLRGLLAGQRVVLVTAPGADGATISGISSDLKLAGARVAGQVSLQQAFFDTGPSTEGDLTQRAQDLAPPSVNLASQPPGSAIRGQEAAAQVLAAALVTRDGPGLTPAQQKTMAAQTAQILAGFGQHGYLQVASPGGGTRLAPATLAVVVIPATPPPGGPASPENLALIDLAQQLAAAGHGALLAGSLPSSGIAPSDSAISEVISGGGGSGASISTVDNANDPTGQIVLAQALSLLLDHHKPGNYGVSTGVVPSPAPTPTPAASDSGSAGKSLRPGRR